jgi:hypothetical protein
LQVGVTNYYEVMGFVWLTVAESDVSMQVGVTKQGRVMGFVWLTAGASDVSMQVVATSMSWRKIYVSCTGWRLEL